MSGKNLLLANIDNSESLGFERFISKPGFTNAADFATYGHQVNIYSIFKGYLNPNKKAIYTCSSSTVGYNALIILKAISGRSYYYGQEVDGNMIYNDINPSTDYTLTWNPISTKRFVIVNDVSPKTTIIFEKEITWLYTNENVTSISGTAASYSQIKNIHVSNLSSITSIPTNAFTRCSDGLGTSVFIPPTVSTIGSSAFLSCDDITDSITIPYGVTSIGAGAFVNCSTSQFIIDSSNLFYKTDGNAIFNYAMTILNHFRDVYNGTYTVPNGVTTLAAQSFWQCAITGIVLPSTLTTLGGDSLSGTKLVILDIPSSVTSLNTYIAQNILTLRTVIIRGQIGVSSLYSTLFTGTNGIISYTIYTTSPPTNCGITNTTYRNNCDLYVPAGSLSLYQNAAGWSNFKSYNAIP